MWNFWSILKLWTFLENVSSPAFCLPHFAFSDNDITFIEYHSALYRVFADFLLFFCTNNKLSISILVRLKQLNHWLVITIVLLFNLSKRSEFPFACFLFFLFKNIQLVDIFDGHFTFKVVRFDYRLFLIFPSWFKTGKLFIRWVCLALLLSIFGSSFDLWLGHYRILLFAAFMRIFRRIWVDRVSIFISVLNQMVHYFGPGKCTFFRLFPLRFPWGIRMDWLIIIIPGKRDLRLRIWWYADRILLSWMFITPCFAIRLLSIAFWILGLNFF